MSINDGHLAEILKILYFSPLVRLLKKVIDGELRPFSNCVKVSSQFGSMWNKMRKKKKERLKEKD